MSSSYYSNGDILGVHELPGFPWMGHSGVGFPSPLLSRTFKSDFRLVISGIPHLVINDALCYLEKDVWDRITSTLYLITWLFIVHSISSSMILESGSPGASA